jgi:hypothetical protein
VLGSGVVGHHNGIGGRLSYGVAGLGPAGWVVLLPDYDHARTGSASTRLAASVEARSRPGMRRRFIAVFYRCLLPSSFGLALGPLSRVTQTTGLFREGRPAFGEG